MNFTTLLLLLFGFSQSSLASELSIQLTYLKNEHGDILYLLFKDDNGFPDDDTKSVRQGRVNTKIAKETGIKLDDLSEGEYAVSLFHDENANNKLDTNFLGIPKEGFGFSQNPYVVFGPPSFKRSRFFIKKDTRIEVKIIYF